MKIARIGAAAATVLAAATVSLPTAAIITQTNSNKDNTLFADTPDGSISDGAGPHFYVGKQGGANIRRGIVAFDLGNAGIPAGATINTATVTLNLSRSTTGTNTLSLFRVSQNWGEGTSNSGDPGGSGAPSTPGEALSVPEIASALVEPTTATVVFFASCTGAEIV